MYQSIYFYWSVLKLKEVTNLDRQLEKGVINILHAIGYIAGIFTITAMILKLTGYRVKSSVYLIDGNVPVYGYSAMNKIQNYIVDPLHMIVAGLITVICIGVIILYREDKNHSRMWI